MCSSSQYYALDWLHRLSSAQTAFQHHPNIFPVFTRVQPDKSLISIQRTHLDSPGLSSPKWKSTRWRLEFSWCKRCSPVKCGTGTNTLLRVVRPHTDLLSPFVLLPGSSLYPLWSVILHWSEARPGGRGKWQRSLEARARRPRVMSSALTNYQRPAGIHEVFCSRRRRVCVCVPEGACGGSFVICVARDWHFDALPTKAKCRYHR